MYVHVYIRASRGRATSHARSRRQSIRSVISGATKNPFSIRAEHSTLSQIFSFASVSRCSIVLVVRDTVERFASITSSMIRFISFFSSAVLYPVLCEAVCEAQKTWWVWIKMSDLYRTMSDSSRNFSTPCSIFFATTFRSYFLLKVLVIPSSHNNRLSIVITILRQYFFSQMEIGFIARVTTLMDSTLRIIISL